MSKRLTMLNKMIEGGSRDPFHHYARALELRSLARGAEALEALESVVREFPDYVPSYLMAAQLASEAGDPARARSLCESGMDAARRGGNEHALAELKELAETLG